MTWRTLTERDRREWKLSEVDPSVRDGCRSNVRSVMRAASQLPGGELTYVDDAPAPGASCSKLMTLLVNVSLEFKT